MCIAPKYPGFCLGAAPDAAVRTVQELQKGNCGAEHKKYSDIKHVGGFWSVSAGCSTIYY